MSQNTYFLQIILFKNCLEPVKIYHNLATVDRQMVPKGVISFLSAFYLLFICFFRLFQVISDVTLLLQAITFFLPFYYLCYGLAVFRWCNHILNPCLTNVVCSKVIPRISFLQYIFLQVDMSSPQFNAPPQEILELMPFPMSSFGVYQMIFKNWH